VLAVLMDLHALSSRAGRAWRAGESVVVEVVFGHRWSFSIRPVEVKRFQASAPLAGLMFPAGPRFSSG
jgi:hypothetical protein